MRRYFTKWLAGIAISLCIFLLMASLGVSLAIRFCRKSFLQNINRHVPGVEWDMGEVYYLAPNYLVVHDIQMRQVSSGSPVPLLRIPRLILSFSLWDFLKSRDLHLSFVSMNKMQGDYLKAWTILKHYEKFLPASADTDFSRMKIRFKDCEIRKSSAVAVYPEDGYLLNAVLYKRKHNLESRGTVGPLRAGGWYRDSGSVLNFEMNLEIGQGAGLIKTLNFKHPSGEGRWQGHWKGGAVALNGYALFDTRSPRDGPFLFLGLKRSRPAFNPDIFILDLNGKFQLKEARVDIDAFDFTLNSIPVNIRGAVFLSRNPASQLNIHVQSPLLKGYVRSWNKVQGEIKTKWRQGRFLSDGGIQFLFDSADLPPGETAAPVLCDFAGLDFDGQNGVLKLSLRKAFIRKNFSGRDRQVTLNDIRIFWNKRLKDVAVLDFSSGLYSGDVRARVWFLSKEDFDDRLYILLNMKEVRLDEFHREGTEGSRVSGSLASRWFIQSDPAFLAKGSVDLAEGQLINIKFLVWFADAFGFKAMKRLAYNRLSCAAVIDPEGLHIDRLSLMADQVSIRGNFSVSKEKMISSRISVIIDRPYLQESPELYQLLKETAEENEKYNFEFQLSGSLGSMNFQWLPSRVKEAIQIKVPDFVERRIERNIDQMIQTRP